MTTASPKRFYARASAVEQEGGFGVALDQHPLKTPGGRAFVAPTRALAETMADEWDMQCEHIIPARMPLTQLSFTALDWTAQSRDQRVEYVVSFAATDLCCHRADAPLELVERQASTWNPLVGWGASELGVRLEVVAGIIAAPPNEAALQSLREHAGALDDFRLTALTQAAGAAGSAVIAFALLRGRLTGESAFNAAALDDLYSLETWGEDAEARARLDRLRAEFENVARFAGLLG